MHREIEISSSDDIIDVRDVIARFEQLSDSKEMVDAAEWAADHEAEEEELGRLASLLDDLEGNGGDEQWRGDWYPITLIRDSYFEDYARELAEDIGAINADASWPNNCIDWEQAARELRMDYSSIEFDGVTYWYR